jgi:sentrin-specific protease 7
MRKEVMSESIVCPMTTYFYTTLSSVGGVEQVLRWTEKMDIFSKLFIFVPVNQALHWSLCIVVNPGLITGFNNDDVDIEVSCLIFLDLLQFHSRKEIAEKLRTWLNAELNRKHNVNDNLFTPITMGSFSP